MKRFLEFIKESGLFHYGTSHIFSEEHRSMLPKNCYMVDVDALYTLNNKIYIVLEDKYKFESKMSKYQIIDKRSWQRQVLKKLSEKIDAFFVILEEKSKTYLRVNENDEDIPTKLPNNRKDLVEHNTANKLYLEIRSYRGQLVIKSIMYLKNGIESYLVDELKQHYRTIEVDIFDPNFIKMTENDNRQYKIIAGDEESWIQQYKYMKLLF